jgi:hypothetical protein
MVRVYRLYLGPMFAPDKLGRDKLMVHRLKLGRELLPDQLGSELLPATGPVYWAFCPFLTVVCLTRWGVLS